MTPAQHQLQPLQVVMTLLLLPQLPLQVCQLASNATDALGASIDCYCHLCNALTATDALGAGIDCDCHLCNASTATVTCAMRSIIITSAY